MADLLALSSRVIDSGVADEPVNRISNELSEVADGLAIVESFSHSVVLDTGDGLVAFDASHARTGADVVAAIGGWTSTPSPTSSTHTATPTTSAGAPHSPTPSVR
jgi:hypothetical protein